MQLRLKKLNKLQMLLGVLSNHSILNFQSQARQSLFQSITSRYLFTHNEARKMIDLQNYECNMLFYTTLPKKVSNAMKIP